jgi:hypothetical protein
LKFNRHRIFMKILSAILIIISVVTFTSFLSFKEKTTNSLSPGAASKFMWDNLHQGNYDSIPVIIEKLRSAWDQSPDDPTLNTHLAFINLWKFCERGRKEPDSSIFEYVFSSNRFFKKAIELNPEDARLYSLRAATEMCEGTIRGDEQQVRRGYKFGLQAVPKWPQFNSFSFAAVESLLDKNSLRFKQGLTYQWITMDECSCKNLTRQEILEHPEKVIPELIAEIQNSTDPKIKRACWNTWIAPHNFEGYLLNFGDMLVKKGLLKEAKRIYEAIKLSPTYKEWPYQSVLEDRIKNMETNEIEFNKPLQLLMPSNSTQLFINSDISCVGCHQMSKQEFETMKREDYR